ncbi:hypothetical protein D9M68_877120 [compost metagenome]
MLALIGVSLPKAPRACSNCSGHNVRAKSNPMYCSSGGRAPVGLGKGGFIVVLLSQENGAQPLPSRGGKALPAAMSFTET